MSGILALPPDRVRTQMIIPVSKQTYFNTKWVRKDKLPTEYDMLFHPPDFDPKSARSDRTDPAKIRKNIWDQEYHKPIPSTNHFWYGRPYWKVLDRNRDFARVQVKNENPHMRIYNVLEWAVLLPKGKELVCY